MKRTYLVLFAMCCMIGISTGCGKKGDPTVPVAPLPLPITEVSGRLSKDSVTLSWSPPTHYTTSKTLDLDDIKYFTILRKTEAPVANRWKFSETLEGWSEAGKTLPLKRHKGTLRTASEYTYLIINSPENIKLKADANRYIQFKLWAKNSQQGYITFITDENATWDTNFDRRFQPAVHTSYYSFHQAFKSVKVKPFRIIPSPPDVVHEYIVDMQTLPTWTGTIQQIGIVLKNSHPKREDENVQTPENQEDTSGENDNVPEQSEFAEQPSQEPEKAQPGYLLEAGLDSVEFVETFEQSVSLYEAPPWVFLDDEEGWASLLHSQIFGASDGVLYAQGNDMTVLFSQQGQQVLANDIQQIRIRMNVTDGEEAYLLLKEKPQESFPGFDAVSTMGSPHPQAIRIPLQDHGQFHTYTIDMSRYVERASSIDTNALSPQKTGNSQKTLPEEQPLQSEENAPMGTAQTGEHIIPAQSLPTINVTQLALVFPAVTNGRHRQIAIDYIDIVSDKEHAPLLTQFDLPSLGQIANNVRKQRLEEHLDFDIPYTELSDEKRQTPVTQITLAKISPHDPAPAEIRNNIFFLTDTGNFSVETDENEEAITATLEYGNRYTYQILVTDRKKRQSELSLSLTVDFVRSPAPPENVSATPGDERITLTWDKPIFTVDRKKIRHLAGYQIFRSQTPAEYLKTPPRDPEASQATEPATSQASKTPRSSEVSVDSQIPAASDTPVAAEAPAVAPRPDLLTVTPKTLIATLPATQIRFTDTGLLNGRRYYYTIVARTSTSSDFGMSEHSEEIVGVPVDNRPPAAPTGLVGVYLRNIVTLHWKQGEKKDFAGFNIFRSDSAAGPFQQLNDEPVFKASYEDVTVEANRRYYYRITAIDDELPPNESLPSEITLVETFSLD